VKTILLNVLSILVVAAFADVAINIMPWWAHDGYPLNLASMLRFYPVCLVIVTVGALAGRYLLPESMRPDRWG